MTSDMQIRPASLKDAPALGAIGPAAYAAAYQQLWSSPADLARHLGTFGETAFRQLLRDERSHVWLAEADGEAVGFLSLLIDSPDPVHSEAGGAEIPRIFLLPQACSKGIGRKLLQAAEAEAQARNVPYVWLDAMDTAGRAIATYLAWGFERIGTSRFPGAVRSEYAGMVVFKKRLTP